MVGVAWVLVLWGCSHPLRAVEGHWCRVDAVPVAAAAAASAQGAAGACAGGGVAPG